MSLNLDFSEIDLNNLDFENIGQWPSAVKLMMSMIVALAVGLGGYFFIVDQKVDRLEREIRKERELKNTYRIKYAAAVNLEIYKQQIEEMNVIFSDLLKRLPTTHETPGLLDDITYIGTTSGLSFSKINWQPELEKEFYTELPIKMDVIGHYHDFGIFMSKIAELPRIVTVHDFDIEVLDDGRLQFSLVAKTYRYKQGGSAQ